MSKIWLTTGMLEEIITCLTRSLERQDIHGDNLERVRQQSRALNWAQQMLHNRELATNRSNAAMGDVRVSMLTHYAQGHSEGRRMEWFATRDAAKARLSELREIGGDSIEPAEITTYDIPRDPVDLLQWLNTHLCRDAH